MDVSECEQELACQNDHSQSLLVSVYIAHCIEVSPQTSLFSCLVQEDNKNQYVYFLQTTSWSWYRKKISSSSLVLGWEWLRIRIQIVETRDH